MEVFLSVDLWEANVQESREKKLLEVEKVPLSEGRLWGSTTSHSPAFSF